MKVIDKAHARRLLESGELISYHVWLFSENFMSCGHDFDPDYGSCCAMDFDSLHEAVDSLESYCNGNWQECEVD